MLTLLFGLQKYVMFLTPVFLLPFYTLQILLLNALEGSASFKPRRLTPHLFNWKPSNPNRHFSSQEVFPMLCETKTFHSMMHIYLSISQCGEHIEVNAQMSLLLWSLAKIWPSLNNRILERSKSPKKKEAIQESNLVQILCVVPLEVCQYSVQFLGL